MYIKRFIVVSLILSFLISCASVKTMTRQEFIDATQKTYQNVSHNDILLAAEKLFILVTRVILVFSIQKIHLLHLDNGWCI